MEIEEKQLSSIRKYPVEILVYLLCFAVTSMAYAVYKLNDKVDHLQTEQKSFLNNDRQVLIETVQKNTAVMERTIQVIDNRNK